MSTHPVVHFEMPYDDAARVSTFYEKVFGWKMRQLGEKMGDYVMAETTDTDDNQMVQTPGTINGGFAPKSEMYQHPSVVVSIDDITASITAVTEAGGTVHGEPMEIPGVGKYVMFSDSEGNKVSMLEPASS